MKKIILLSLCAQLFILGINAQENKNQTEEFATIKQGNYTAYLTHQEDGKYVGGIENLDYKITKVEDYKIQPGAHKEIHFISGGSPEQRENQTSYMYLPDNEAFPVTYIESVYKGNKELQEAIGYVPHKQEYEDDRLVFLDGKIYIIDNWRNKDDYTLKAVLEFEEKEMGLFKMMKASAKSPKKMEAMQPVAALQKYLDAATKKQQEVYSTWIRNPSNKAFVANQKAKSELMSKTITKMSTDWRNSDEYRRIQENNRMADNARAASFLTVKNNTGRKIYVSAGSNPGSYTNIGPNSSSSEGCKEDLYYGSEGNSSASRTKFYNANQSCGGTIEINY